jgi:hypothetical protein
MISGTFRLAGEIVNVIVKGNELLFLDSSGTITTIEGLKLDKTGTLREFPDLKDDDEWKRKAIDRLKEHIKKMKTEKEAIYYVKEELEKFGYASLFKQQAGFRPQRF